MVKSGTHLFWCLMMEQLLEGFATEVGVLKLRTSLRVIEKDNHKSERDKVYGDPSAYEYQYKS